MPCACPLVLALAWIERNRSAPSRLAIAVRSGSGMNSSVRRVRITSTPGDLLQQLLEPQRDVEHELGFGDAFALRARIVAAVARDRSRCARRRAPADARSTVRRSRCAPAAPPSRRRGLARRAVVRRSTTGRSRRLFDGRRIRCSGGSRAPAGCRLRAVALGGGRRSSAVGALASDREQGRGSRAMPGSLRSHGFVIVRAVAAGRSGALAAGSRVADRALAAAAPAVAWRRGRHARQNLVGHRGGGHRRRHAHAIDHEAVRAVERVHAVAGDAGRVEHDARRVVRMPADANLADDVGVAFEADASDR